jgi:uncharacterized delta-60 repeat protein
LREQLRGGSIVQTIARGGGDGIRDDRSRRSIVGNGIRRMRSAATAAAVVVVVVLATALPAWADAGDPDTTFGGTGVVRSDFAGQFDIAFDAVVQPNGRIVAVGQAADGSTFVDADFAVARYLANGDPDTAFSGDGLQRTDFVGDGDSAAAVALDAGKIVVAGSSDGAEGNSRFAVARYGSGGGLDSTFSGDGKVRTTFPGFLSAVANDVAVRGDGRIVVVGGARTGPPHLRDRGGDGSQTDVAVARYKSGGALDGTFGGGDGRVTTDFAGSSEQGQAVALLDSGAILVAGLSQIVSGEQRIVVVKYRANGTLDPGFDGDGRVVVNMVPGESEEAVGIAVRGDGKIVVGASVHDAVSGTSAADVGVLLLNGNGSIATSFGGGDGKTFNDYGGAEDTFGMVRDTAGKLLFVGVRPPVGAVPQALRVYRLTSSGGKDLAYGTAGAATVEDPDGIGGFGLAVDASNRAIAVGRAGIGNDADFAVARLQA